MRALPEQQPPLLVDPDLQKESEQAGNAHGPCRRRGLPRRLHHRCASRVARRWSLDRHANRSAKADRPRACGRCRPNCSNSPYLQVWSGLPARTRRGQKHARMHVDATLQDELLAAIPSLRAFAISLTINRDRADDLVQDTILRAFANIDKFQPETNLNAWLFTTLRNLFHSEYRERKYETEGPDGAYAARLKTHPDQQSHLTSRTSGPLWQRSPQTRGGTSLSWGTGSKLRKSRCRVQRSGRYGQK